MKPVLTALWIALASSAVSAAAPDASPPAPAPARQAAADEAPSPQRLELARRLVGLADPAETMAEGVGAGFWRSASESLLDIEDEAERAAAEDQLEQLLTRLQPKIRELMPAFLDAYAQLYAREFSAEELEQMIAFAQSPAGRHYLASLAALESDPLLGEAQAKLMTGLAPILDDYRKQLCAKRAAQRLAAGDTKAKCALG